MDRQAGLRRPGLDPELGPSRAARSHENLIAEPNDLPRVIAAVHHACHTLTQLAAADRRQLSTALAAGRLVVPTRSLPGRSDIPYRFAKAPPARAAPLLDAYQEAGTASRQAANALAEIAATIRAPSHILTTARAAVHGAPADPAEPRASRHPIPRLPGPVERTLLDLDITDPDHLKRAAAIDQAADQIILSAAQAAHASGWVAKTDPKRSAGTAELINHVLTIGDERAAILLHSPQLTTERQAEIEP